MPREQFQHNLGLVEQGVLDMGAMVERQTERAMRALADHDLPLAQAVIRDDGEVNRTRFHLDNMCISLLAQQAPMASDLRLIVAVLSMVSDLERMGDYADGIARIVLASRDEPAVAPLTELQEMAAGALHMMREALGAFADRDADRALRVDALDDEVDRRYVRLYGTLVRMMTDDPARVEACTRVLWVSHNLERIADRAKNLASRVVFTVTGDRAESDASAPL